GTDPDWTNQMFLARILVRRATSLKMQGSWTFGPATMRRSRSSGNRRIDPAQHAPLHCAGTRGYTAPNGAVAEWSKAHAWKVCRRETVSRVRIPVAPPHSDTESVQGPRLGPFFFLFQRALAGPSALRRLDA